MNKWREAKGYKPNTSATEVFVRYRNGMESKAAYPTARQRWSHVSDPWDIMAYRVPEAEQKDEAA